jgi:hypothetical protein
VWGCVCASEKSRRPQWGAFGCPGVPARSSARLESTIPPRALGTQAPLPSQVWQGRQFAIALDEQLSALKLGAQFRSPSLRTLNPNANVCSAAGSNGRSGVELLPNLLSPNVPTGNRLDCRLTAPRRLHPRADAVHLPSPGRQDPSAIPSVHGSVSIIRSCRTGGAYSRECPAPNEAAYLAPGRCHNLSGRHAHTLASETWTFRMAAAVSRPRSRSARYSIAVSINSGFGLAGSKTPAYPW